MMIGINTQLKAGIYALLTLFVLFLLIQLLLGSLYVAVRPGTLSSPSSLEPLLLITGLSFISWLGWELKDEATELILQAINSGTPRLKLIPYISLLPAFAEELFFRGAVQGTLERLAPKRPRLVWGLTSVLFALMHLSVLGFVTRSLLGYGFSYLCSRTHSLWPGIALHALNNLIVLYLL